LRSDGKKKKGLPDSGQEIWGAKAEKKKQEAGRSRGGEERGVLGLNECLPGLSSVKWPTRAKTEKPKKGESRSQAWILVKLKGGSGGL